MNRTGQRTLQRSPARRTAAVRIVAAAAVLASCGSLPFVTDDDTAVTGTDESALRAAADDALAAFIAGDVSRFLAYIDPACGVTAERIDIVLVETEAFVLGFTGLTLEEAYGSASVASVSVDGSTGTVTQLFDELPSIFENDAAAETDNDGTITTSAPTGTETTETEWMVVEGRWVVPSCVDYLTFEEQEQFGNPSSVRFDSNGSVIVLEPSDDGSETTAPELVLDPATGVAPETGSGIEDAFGSDDSDNDPPATAPPTTAPSSTAPTTGPSTTVPAPPPTAAPTPIKLDSARIIASVSSELPPFRELSYGASNLFDGVLETAWNHCGECTGTSGVGQRITLGFTEPVTVVGIRIANGYQKEANDVFTRNHRVAQLTVRDIEATVSQTLDVVDAKGYQLFSLPGITTTGLFLDIDAIHTGSDYPDLAVSEIEVFVLPTS